MNIHDIYTSESKYLRAENLPPSSRVPVTIESFEIGSFKDDQGVEKKQVCLKFVGKDKLLGLNKTNATTIEALIGSPDVDTWAGYQIKLYRTKTDFGGKQVDCIRIDDGFCLNRDGKSTIQDIENPDEVAF